MAISSPDSITAVLMAGTGIGRFAGQEGLNRVLEALIGDFEASSEGVRGAEDIPDCSVGVQSY